MPALRARGYSSVMGGERSPKRSRWRRDAGLTRSIIIARVIVEWTSVSTSFTGRSRVPPARSVTCTSAIAITSSGLCVEDYEGILDVDRERLRHVRARHALHRDLVGAHVRL